MAKTDGVERAASSMFHGAWITVVVVLGMFAAYGLVSWCVAGSAWRPVWLLTVLWFAFTLLCWNDAPPAAGGET